MRYQKALVEFEENFGKIDFDENHVTMMRILMMKKPCLQSSA